AESEIEIDVQAIGRKYVLQEAVAVAGCNRQRCSAHVDQESVLLIVAAKTQIAGDLKPLDLESGAGRSADDITRKRQHVETRARATAAGTREDLQTLWTKRQACGNARQIQRHVPIGKHLAKRHHHQAKVAKIARRKSERDTVTIRHFKIRLQK